MELILYTPVGYKLKSGEIKGRMEPSPLGLFITLNDWNLRERLYQQAVTEHRNQIAAHDEIIKAQAAAIEEYKRLLTPSPPPSSKGGVNEDAPAIVEDSG